MNGSVSPREHWVEVMVGSGKAVSLRPWEAELARDEGLPLEVWGQIPSTRTQRKTDNDEREARSGN